jgi:hypothetical protein
VPDAAQDRLALAPHGLQREARQQRDEQRLQHRSLGERGDQRARDDAQQELDRALARRHLVLAVGADLVRELQPLTRVQDVAHHQADDQGDGRHEQEVADGERPDPADLRGLGHRADAQHDRAEDDRTDHHLDQVDEALAERLQVLADLRPDEADQDAGGHRHDDGDVEQMGSVALARLDRR